MKACGNADGEGVGRFQIKIDEGGLEAQVLLAKGPAATVADLRQALSDAGVCHGIDDSALLQLGERAADESAEGRRLLAAIQDPSSIERRQSAPRQAGRVGAAGDGPAIRGAGVGGGTGSAGWWGWLARGVISARDGGSGGGCRVLVGEWSA